MAEISETKVTKLYVNSNTVSRLLGSRHIRAENCIIGQDGAVSVSISSSRHYSVCPECGKRSWSVHSRYERRLHSTALFARQVNILFKARKFRCTNHKCPRKIFSEQIDGLSEPYSRLTTGARSQLEKILLEVSARKGSLLSGYIGLPMSPSTCLRMVHRIPLPAVDPSGITRVHIDDFAFRKGVYYGTILKDADTRRVLGIVEGRSSADAAALLRRFPNIKMASRDRSEAFAKALSEVIPDAIQVADRFHIVKNCVDYLAEQLKKSQKVLFEEVSGLVGSDVTIGLTKTEMEVRKEVTSRRYYARISEYYSKGLSVEDIVTRHNFRRLAVTECVRELKRTEADGIRKLAARITDKMALKAYLSCPNYGVDRNTGECSEKRDLMDRITGVSPSLSFLREYVLSLKAIFHDRDIHRLDEWIDKYSKSSFEKVAAFAKGLDRDIESIRNALLFSISNGPIEGTNNKLKTLKRAMYGRAGIELLIRKMALAKSG